MSPATGDDAAGGAVVDDGLEDAQLHVVHVGPMDNVAYLLRCRATGAGLLVDAAAEAPRLLALVGDRLDVVVTTHRHDDHHAALADVVAATGARTLAGADDADALPVPVDEGLHHGDVVRAGDLALEVVHLRGHTPGSVALVHRDRGGRVLALTGDSLFPGGVGNTFGDPAAFTTLLDDVEARLFEVLPDRTEVLPGHGAPTTLGAERPSLAAWRARGW
ncbi:MBL fold metallo-hydrolase [Pseudokineococcus lusitanus]|uniref:Glyoxylase-like metal-dependent hydrolase (Beta-lactamase superfamily II) n=1 Tax=Pseudokineococcus lusitanus TaxID=763993 RepID=A0A3N1HSR2_9ACTN|nr:MBL fold metallo-hydrolase [Pseudokineococcus lusitanus]ROP45432.1 glyoxylase-like metal-dependent hydrolase (beta-lactamase superfamily II) [Pseudokineococcus lusitanus]